MGKPKDRVSGPSYENNLAIFPVALVLAWAFDVVRSPLFEIASVLVRLDHVARCIERGSAFSASLNSSNSAVFVFLALPQLWICALVWYTPDVEKSKPSPHKTPVARFKRRATQVVFVPSAEIQKRETEYKEQRKIRSHHRHR